jgi:hypothetical protein
MRTSALFLTTLFAAVAISEKEPEFVTCTWDSAKAVETCTPWPQTQTRAEKSVTEKRGEPITNLVSTFQTPAAASTDLYRFYVHMSSTTLVRSSRGSKREYVSTSRRSCLRSKSCIKKCHSSCTHFLATRDNMVSSIIGPDSNVGCTFYE